MGLLICLQHYCFAFLPSYVTKSFEVKDKGVSCGNGRVREDEWPKVIHTRLQTSLNMVCSLVSQNGPGSESVFSLLFLIYLLTMDRETSQLGYALDVVWFTNRFASIHPWTPCPLPRTTEWKALNHMYPFKNSTGDSDTKPGCRTLVWRWRQVMPVFKTNGCRGLMEKPL